jgi:hypothetical protein
MKPAQLNTQAMQASIAKALRLLAGSSDPLAAQAKQHLTDALRMLHDPGAQIMRARNGV